MLFDGASIDMQEEWTSWQCIARTKSSCSGLHRSQSSKRILSAAPALLSTRDDDCPEWLLGMWTRQNNFLPWYLKEKAVFCLLLSLLSLLLPLPLLLLLSLFIHSIIIISYHHHHHHYYCYYLFYYYYFFYYVFQFLYKIHLNGQDYTI